MRIGVFRIKKLKGNNNTAELGEKRSLKRPFFKMVNEEILLLILKFFNGKDLIMFATISREARWIIPSVLNKVSYSIEIEKA